MRTPALQGLDERGKRWLPAKAQEILAARAVALATPCSKDTPTCSWGIGLETGTTLYLRLTGDREPHALRFHHALLRDCGAGRYARQQEATSSFAGR